MKIYIPGGWELDIEYVVMDFNGTIAVDGKMKECVASRIIKLAKLYKVYVITSDTQGTASRELAGLPVTLEIYDTDNAGEKKLKRWKGWARGAAPAWETGATMPRCFRPRR